MTSEAKKYLFEQIVQNSVLRSSSTGEPIVSKSGNIVDWIIDLRPLLLRSEFVRLLAKQFWAKFEDFYPFQVCGVEFSGIPLAIAIQYEGSERGLPINVFIVRKERKTSGRCRQYEGHITSDRIIVVDDIMNSGGSYERAVNVIEQCQMNVFSAYSIVDFGKEAKLFNINKVRRQCLFTLLELGLDRANDEETGSPVGMDLVWAFTPQMPIYAVNVPRSDPIIYNNSAHFGSSDSKFYCIDCDTGAVKWCYATSERPKGILSSPVVHGDAITFGTYSGSLITLDISTGLRVWENTDCDHIGSSPCVSEDGRTLFVGLQYNLPRQRGALGAFDAKTGKQIWWQPVREWLHSSPCYLNGLKSVCVGTNDGYVISCDEIDGRINWKFYVGREIRSKISYIHSMGTIFFGAFDGNIYALDADSGFLKWKFETKDPVYAQPLICNSLLFCGSTDKRLYILEAETGNLLKTVHTDGKIYSSPNIIEGTIWFGSNDGGLRGINIDNLKLERKMTISERLLTRPAMAERVLVIGGAGGSLFGFKV